MKSSMKSSTNRTRKERKIHKEKPATRNRSRLGLIAYFLALGTAFSGLVFPDTLDFGQANPVIRECFLRQSLEMRHGVLAYSMPEAYRRSYLQLGGRRLQRLEQHTDGLIQDFTARVSQKLGDIGGRFSEARRFREQALDKTAHPNSRLRAQKKLGPAAPGGGRTSERSSQAAGVCLALARSQE